MEVYLVGGAVRDELLGRAVSERDWVVVGGTAEAMLADGYRQVGKDFPVFLHPETGEEYALARTERKTGPGHKGFAVHADPSVTLEEDLARRDLTINAIARSQAGTLVDPYGGRADLEARLLRHVSVAFAEDPLRVFRVARFAAQLPEFEVAPETQMLIREMAAADALAELSAERVWAELVKALGGPAAGRFIDVLRTCDALKPWFEEFESVRPVLLDLPDDAQRFAGFVSNLAPEVLERLAVRLKTPRAHLRLALWIARHGKALARWQNEPADRIYAALTECRAFKPGNDLAWMLAVVEQLYGLDLTPLVDAVAQIGVGIRPADLQAQGIQGAALGAALDQARIKALRVAQRAG